MEKTKNILCFFGGGDDMAPLVPRPYWKPRKILLRYKDFFLQEYKNDLDQTSTQIYAFDFREIVHAFEKIRFLQNNNQSKLNLIYCGHSYGAVTAIKLCCLSLPDLLITLDPVGYEKPHETINFVLNEPSIKWVYSGTYLADFWHPANIIARIGNSWCLDKKLCSKIQSHAEYFFIAGDKNITHKSVTKMMRIQNPKTNACAEDYLCKALFIN